MATKCANLRNATKACTDNFLTIRAKHSSQETNRTDEKKTRTFCKLHSRKFALITTPQRHSYGHGNLEMIWTWGGKFQEPKFPGVNISNGTEWNTCAVPAESTPREFEPGIFGSLDVPPLFLYLIIYTKKTVARNDVKEQNSKENRAYTNLQQVSITAVAGRVDARFRRLETINFIGRHRSARSCTTRVYRATFCKSHDSAYFPTSAWTDGGTVKLLQVRKTYNKVRNRSDSRYVCVSRIIILYSDGSTPARDQG